MKYTLLWLFIASLAIGATDGVRENILTSRKIIDVASQCGIKPGKSHYIDSIVTYCDEPYIGLEAISRKNYDQKPLLCNAAYEVLFILCIQNPEKKLPYDIHMLDKYHEKNIYLTKFCDLFPNAEQSKFAVNNTHYAKVIMDILGDKKMCLKTCSKLDGNLIPICVFLLFETPRLATKTSNTHRSSSNEKHFNGIHDDLLKAHVKSLNTLIEPDNAIQNDENLVPAKPYLLEDEERAHEIYLKKYLESLPQHKKQTEDEADVDCTNQINCKGEMEKLIQDEKDSIGLFASIGNMIQDPFVVLGMGAMVGLVLFIIRKKLLNILCYDNEIDKRR